MGYSHYQSPPAFLGLWPWNAQWGVTADSVPSLVYVALLNLVSAAQTKHRAWCGRMYPAVWKRGLCLVSSAQGWPLLPPWPPHSCANPAVWACVPRAAIPVNSMVCFSRSSRITCPSSYVPHTQGAGFSGVCASWAELNRVEFPKEAWVLRVRKPLVHV